MKSMILWMAIGALCGGCMDDSPAPAPTKPVEPSLGYKLCVIDGGTPFDDQVNRYEDALSAVATHFGIDKQKAADQTVAAWQMLKKRDEPISIVHLMAGAISIPKPKIKSDPYGKVLGALVISRVKGESEDASFRRVRAIFSSLKSWEKKRPDLFHG